MEARQAPIDMADLSSIDVVILAGGRGTRLRTVISDQPKVLANVNGRPFIFYLLDQLCAAGIMRVIICTGYMGEYLEKMIGGKYRMLEIVYSREETPLGTGGALRQAVDMIRDGWFLAMNGDSFIDISYPKFFSWHIEKGGKLSVVVTPINNANRYGSVALNASQKIISFSEKSRVRSDNYGLISAGIYLMHTSITETFPVKNKLSLEKEVLPKFIDDEFYGYIVNGDFIDIGTPESFLSASELFRSILQRSRSTDLYGKQDIE